MPYAARRRRVCPGSFPILYLSPRYVPRRVGKTCCHGVVLRVCTLTCMLSRKDFDRPWRWGRDRGGPGHPPSFHLTARPAPGSGEAFEAKIRRSVACHMAADAIIGTSCFVHARWSLSATSAYGPMLGLDRQPHGPDLPTHQRMQCFPYGKTPDSGNLQALKAQLHGLAASRTTISCNARSSCSCSSSHLPPPTSHRPSPSRAISHFQSSGARRASLR